MCWNKGRLCWKTEKLFYFCHLKKLVRPETFGPYYVHLQFKSYIIDVMLIIWSCFTLLKLFSEVRKLPSQRENTLMTQLSWGTNDRFRNNSWHKSYHNFTQILPYYFFYMPSPSVWHAYKKGSCAIFIKNSHKIDQMYVSRSGKNEVQRGTLFKQSMLSNLKQATSQTKYVMKDVKLPLPTPWRHEEVEIQLHSFLTLALDVQLRASANLPMVKKSAYI